MFDISNILVLIVAISSAISVHEFGHAYVAHLLGDDTAKAYGRLTLNPAKHLDPIGLLMMMIFRIGWAKPVPINPNNFKNYKLGNLLVSLAGPAFNVLMAIVCAIIYKNSDMYAIKLIANTTIIYNVFFAAFNLLPIPPLDGWGIVSSYRPYKYYESVYKYESMSNIIFLVLIVTGIHSVFVTPVSNMIYKIVYLFL